MAGSISPSLVRPLGRGLMIEMAVILILLACVWGTTDAAPEIRLVNGPNHCSGRVEVLHNGQWGTVCDDNWDMRDARVVCQELGCGAASSVPADAHFGRGAGPIWLDGVKCKGTESALSQCPANPWGESNCDHREDASVVCSGVASDSDPAFEIRLVNGPHRCSGRVEVFYHRFWGTICDNGWGIEEARVVCRQLGCGEARSAESDAQFGRGDKPIWLDDFRCKGTESALSQCPASDWGENNCTHSEDAGVVCSGGVWGSDPSTTNQEIRLVNGPRRCTGRVELFHDGHWGTVCDDGWDIKEARVVCRQLGCGAAKFAPDRALYGGGSGPIWLADLGCNGTESALSQCPAREWGVNNCRHQEDASVVCSGVDFISNTTVEVRLVNGSSKCSGRVELFHDDQWGTVCDDGWGMLEAKVICQQLGCGDPRSAPVGAQFGRGDGPIWLNDVQCKGTESALSQCQAKPWGINNCNHGEDAGVICSS